MSRVLVVGSGASGVHYALTALRRGHEVTMLDVGFRRPPAVEPLATIDELKQRLDRPVAYFIGHEGQKVVYPSPHAKPFGFPPNKGYVFQRPDGFRLNPRGIDPYVSFARGGLAEVWTAGSYEYSDHDLADFPFSAADLRPHYAEVARRIGVCGAEDDVARFSPFSADYLEPLPLDPHSARLMAGYERTKRRLNAELGFYMGRSRVATLSRDFGGRRACSNLGRCLWGCPHDALYTPSVTIGECAKFPTFTYVPGRLVRRFEYDDAGRVNRVVSAVLDGGPDVEDRADVFVLAAGALPTIKIYLDSLRHAGERHLELRGLMDNPQAMIPFLTPAMVGKPVVTASYQYHLLAIGIEGSNGSRDAHGQITTLKAASIHPIVQSLPFDLRTSVSAFRAIRAGLGVVNVWTSARRTEQNRVSLEPSKANGDAELLVECREDPDERRTLDVAVSDVRKALATLGCLTFRFMVQTLPIGASGRYGGLLPMSSSDAPHTCTPWGKIRGFENLFVVDGSGFPALPSKNITFTLMANAVRVAESTL